MKFTGNVYRPPFESSSLLLQVTVGCSHNRCAFCTMYRGVPFQMESLDQIARDLDEARQFAPHTDRVFLENGDPFVLSAQRLAAIADLIHQKLPAVETIAMYASVNNIKTKSDADLRLLRSLGINELNIGVESGLDEALNIMEKGYSADEALRELLRLRDAGIDFGANIIFGSAGTALRIENALKTAELINRTQPYLIFTGTIHADPGCPLYDQMKSGAFSENTIGQYLEEEETFIHAANVENCYYFGLHPSNIVPLAGLLREEKQLLLDKLNRKRKSLRPELLDSKPDRYGEGGIII